MDIFVSGIPFKFKEKDLIATFEPYGVVESAKIILDKISRQNKGFGFVKMNNDDEAKAAIKALNGSELQGRKILAEKAAGLPGGKPHPSNSRKGKGKFDKK